MTSDQPPRPNAPEEHTPNFASRAGAKLHHAIVEFGLEPAGRHCADLGCSAGGFVSCWLHHGAERVHAVDTAYGVLDYRLRTDPRVNTIERTNALHARPPDELNRAGLARFVSVDLSWTPQHLALPAAARWTAPGNGIIVSLIKPHYEANAPLWRDRFGTMLERGALRPDDAEAVAGAVLEHASSELGFELLGRVVSPIAGGKSSRKRKGPANTEFLALLKPPGS